MRIIRYFFVAVALVGCSNGISDERQTPTRFIQDPKRSCESIFATKFETVDALLDDFYQNAMYKDSLELNLRLGTYYYYHKDYDSSIYFYRQAEKIDDSEFELYYNMSLVYSDKSDFSNALILVEKAISMCGNRWDLLNSKCYVLGKLNRCDEAIESGLISKQLNPDNVKIYGNLLRCFDKMNKADSVRDYIHQIDSRFDRSTDWIDSLREKYISSRH